MIQGFRITEKLHETGSSVVYRATRVADGRRVVLKMLNSQYPTPRKLARYRQEYELTRSLGGPGVGVIEAYSLESQGNTAVIILEDCGGSSLNHCFARRRPTIEELLDLAIQLTRALGHIHGQGIIHKDINPSNLVWNAGSGQLEIIDFGIATRLASESPTLEDPGVIEGTLPYISPEQSGRMNRRLDYRSDYYSLGATLYELATGEPPFVRMNALELVHCHLAAQPQPPIERRADLPPMLSRIILKLLAKAAEDRYQSARGLEADLRRCLGQVRSGQTAETFPLGRDDASEHFAIPQKLYGRARETGILLDAFERIAQGARACVLVTGYSGIGKSSLVRELYKPVTRRSAFFVSGKFDQLQRATPYSALAAACGGLVKQILTRGKDELRRWQAALQSALGPSGRVLIDVIPELELLMGLQSPVEGPEPSELGPAEAQNRLNLAFSSFLRVFCQAAHPLVIFLDDLQWVDAATLRLLEPMMSSEELSHLLLIGAYRDNEVDAAHPLATVLRGIEDRGVPASEIHLSPLGLEDVMQMLADMLRHTPASVRSLAELVLRRTGGNPFFVGEFLKTLHEEELLRFDASIPGWCWDMAGIEATPVSEGVVELLHPKLRRFPEATQALLRLAACIGSGFDLDTIAIIADREPAESAGALMAAVQEGYLLPASKPEVMETEQQEPRLLIRAYRFAHDRVQQAAYALIPAEQRAAIHLEIGRLLLARLGPAEREERLFELVDHLNLGRALLETASGDLAVTPVALARLNLAAGVRARESAAYAAAARYLGIGLELAGHAWNDEHELALALHVEGAMAEYCQGDFERSQTLIDAALPQARSAVVKARLYRMLLGQYTNQSRFEEAFQAAREALQLLGHTLPQASELEAAVQQELVRSRQLLGDRPIESLIDAPEMADDRHRAALEILTSLVSAAYQSNMAMHSFIAARAVNLTLEHGQCAAGVMGYVAYAVMSSAELGAYQRGYQFGVLAMRLADRFHTMADKCRIGSGLSGLIMPWARPIEEIYPINSAGFEAGLQSGELQYASFTLMFRQALHFHHGTSLARVIEEASAGVRFSKRNSNTTAANLLDAFRIVAAYLSGDRGHDPIPSMEADEDYLARCRQERSLMALAVYHVAKCQALYLDRAYERALEVALEADRLCAYIGGMITVAVASFYHSLCLTALYPQGSPAQQRDHWQRLESQQAQMKRWAESCPANFQHMYLLVAAEMARITGEPLVAMDLYAQAVDAAEASGFRQDLALANELAACFYLDRGRTSYAMFHLRNAHYGYALWGAKRKLALLEAQHGELLVQPRADGAPGEPAQGTTRRTTSSAGTSASTSEQLDLASVVKASQALSSEISLDRLLARLIEIVIESAGAQQGFLILQQRGRLAIEAQGTLGEGEVAVLRSVPLEGEGPPLVSAAIVHYVLRSRETVVLHDAMHEGAFVLDPHVVATRARSILCMPLLNQGKVSGVVYLENKLSPQAFTPERVELLALLSSQMAISLDNSFLYSDLQRASQDLEGLLNSTAHDLKEPLRAVQLFSDLLVRRHGAQVDAQGRDYLARIGKASRRVGELLDAIRKLSEIRHLGGPHQPVAGASLVEDALRRLQPVIEQTRATVRTSDALPTLLVDQRWAAEAIYQVVHNALLHTGAGLAAAPGPGPGAGAGPGARIDIDTDIDTDIEIDIEIDIDIEPYQGSEGVGLVIKDRGPGIPEEYAERVFELFRRAVGREVPGTGAGLAIARQVATKHGGNAWLSPRPGGGTEVYITFGR